MTAVAEPWGYGTSHWHWVVDDDTSKGSVMTLCGGSAFGLSPFRRRDLDDVPADMTCCGRCAATAARLGLPPPRDVLHTARLYLANIAADRARMAVALARPYNPAWRKPRSTP